MMISANQSYFVIVILIFVLGLPNFFVFCFKRDTNEDWWLCKFLCNAIFVLIYCLLVLFSRPSTWF